MIIKTLGMAQDTASMLAEAAIFAVLSFVVSVSTLRIRVTLVVVGIKFLLPVAYFLAFHGPYWLLIDDNTYYDNQTRLFNAGYTLFSLTWPKVLFILQFFGQLWNLIGLAMFSLFGPGYSTNIYLDIFLTFACVPYIMRALIAAGIRPSTAWAYCIFFLLHLELITQSSLFDMRDTMIMTFTTVAITSYISLLKYRSLTDLVSAAVALVLVFLLRPYATMILIIVFSTASLWTLEVTPRTYARFKILLLAIAGTIIITIGWIVVHYRAQLTFLSAPSLTAMVQFLFSPLAWNLGEPFYGWVRPFAIFDNVTGPIMFLGAYLLWRDYTRLRILLIVLAAYMIVYGMISAITGDYRLRYQIIITYSLMQFFGIFALIYFARYRTAKWRGIYAPKKAPSPEIRSERNI